METELKLLVDPSDVVAFKENSLLKRHAMDKPHLQHLESTYFDTPGLFLRRHGASLRVRHVDGQGWVQTLKGRGNAGSGLHQRDEWETPLDGPQPDLKALARLIGNGGSRSKLLSSRDLAKQLVPLFTTDVRRTIWTLRLANGDAVELALDQGTVRHDKSQLPINEIELELKAGDPAHLFDFALALQDSIPVRIGNITKSERGFSLCVPQPPPVANAARTELFSGMTVEQGMQAIIENCLAQIEGNVEGIAYGNDPENVHQMRVGLRRLNSALRLFRNVAPCPDELLSGFKWLSGKLGEARDWEVLAGKTLPAVATRFPGRTGLLQLQAAAAEIARDRRSAAAQAVASTRYARLMLGFGAWVKGLRWRESASRAQLDMLASPVETFANESIEKSWRRLLRRGKGLARLAPGQRHKARIAAKRVRYVTGFFESLYKPKKVTQFVENLSDLQDALGRLNDASVGGALLENAACAWPDLAAACGFMQGYFAAQSESGMAELAAAWKRFRKAKPPC